MPKLNGTILYEIALDGCINGLYSNDVHGEVLNEILKKRTLSSGNDDTLVGDYDSLYFDKISRADPTEYWQATVSITLGAEPNVFSLVWNATQINGSKKATFRGKGFRLNERQFSVTYDY